MTDSKVQNKHRILSVWIMTCGLLYTFIYQFRLPFKADLFLYGMLAGLVAMTFFYGYVVINKQVVLFVLIDICALAGLVYTTNFSEGLRETMLFIFFSGVFVFSFENLAFIKLFTKWIYLASVAVVISCTVHFIFPEWFNSIMAGLMRPNAYEQLMWSYTVDETFAGIAAYTSNATFSAAIVFGNSFLNLTNRNEQPIIKNKIANAVFLALSLFTIIICSKRGIFIATIVATIVLMFYLYRRNAFILKFASVAILFVAVLAVLYQLNDYVAAFIDRFMTDDLLTGRDTIYDSLMVDLWNGNILIGKGTAATYAIADKGAHNIYLQILYDHGALFSIPYYIFLIYNYCVAFKNKCPISIFVQTMFLVYGLSGNPLYSNMFMIIYIYYVLYASKSPVINSENIKTE